MDLMFDISGLAQDKEEFSTSKKDVLKFLKIIGVDTRFISYTPQKIYIIIKQEFMFLIYI